MWYKSASLESVSVSRYSAAAGLTFAGKEKLRLWSSSRKEAFFTYCKSKVKVRTTWPDAQAPVRRRLLLHRG